MKVSGSWRRPITPATLCTAVHVLQAHRWAPSVARRFSLTSLRVLASCRRNSSTLPWLDGEPHVISQFLNPRFAVQSQYSFNTKTSAWPQLGALGQHDRRAAHPSMMCSITAALLASSMRAASQLGSTRVDVCQPRIGKVWVGARLDVAGQALGGVLRLTRLLAQLPRQVRQAISLRRQLVGLARLRWVSEFELDCRGDRELTPALH